jgi:hypothetical protein
VWLCQPEHPGSSTILANTPLMTTGRDLPFPWAGLLPSTAGYAQMTQLAETAIATENLTLKSSRQYCRDAEHCSIHSDWILQ